MPSVSQRLTLNVSRQDPSLLLAWAQNLGAGPVAGPVEGGCSVVTRNLPPRWVCDMWVPERLVFRLRKLFLFYDRLDVDLIILLPFVFRCTQRVQVAFGVGGHVSLGSRTATPANVNVSMAWAPVCGAGAGPGPAHTAVPVTEAVRGPPHTTQATPLGRQEMGHADRCGVKLQDWQEGWWPRAISYLGRGGLSPYPSAVEGAEC